MTATLADLLVDDTAVVHEARRAASSRARVVAAALVAASAVVLAATLVVGDFPVAVGDVLAALVGRGDGDAAYVVRELRLPRALTAALVGAALGMSGAILQSLARNPLASPDIIGITAGASAAAVFVIVVVHGSGAVVSLGALCGGLIAAGIVILLASKRGLSTYRLILIGIGVAAALSAVTAYLLTRADIRDAQRASIWLTGSVNGRDWDHVRTLGAAMLVLVPLVALLAKPLRMLQLGDDTASGLGVPVGRARLALLLVSVALAAVAIAAAGPVAFVAFLAAPIGRRLARSPLALAVAALFGAALVLAADLLARRLFAPRELPVGVITGIIGAPYLIWLITRTNRLGRGG